MQLHYRNATYTMTQSALESVLESELETGATTLVATYRGQAYPMRKPSSVSVGTKRPGHILKFRGNSYL
ncbi:MAG: DUF4278 domain-containing protein [Cyanobacteria bacterium P01_F01_bin.150]